MIALVNDGHSVRLRSAGVADTRTRQSGVVVDVNPMPKGLGEPLGQAKQTAISDALGSPELC